MPYINMNPPWVCTCSPSWTPLPPPSLYHPSGSYLASCWTSLFGCSKGTFDFTFPKLNLSSLPKPASLHEWHYLLLNCLCHKPTWELSLMHAFPSFLKSSLWQDLLVTLNHLSFSHICLFYLPTCCGLVQASLCLTWIVVVAPLPYS